MNPKLFLTLFSFRKELKYVAMAFGLAILIPIIAVILLTQIGLDIISVTWGFNDEMGLRKHGATHVVDSPDAILKLLG